MGAGVLAKGSGRRRGRGRKRGLMAEINVTPFVDVMLVLLIVFMITAPLLTAGVPVELPKTEARPLPADKQPLTVSIKKTGEIYIQETEISLDDLLPRLEAVASEGYNQRIFIRADSDSGYGRVAEVMAMINSAGYRNLGLVTQSPRTGRRASEER